MGNVDISILSYFANHYIDDDENTEEEEVEEEWM